MKQKIKAVLDEDRGVSPVIGVILMVAITVILAAVIGTFVLGLGDSLEQAPQAQLNAELGDSSNIEISHDGGDSLTVSDIDVIFAEEDSQAFDSGTDFGDDEFGVGDSATSDTGNTYSSGAQVRIVHTPSDSIILDTTV